MKTEVKTIDRETAERYLNLDRGNNRPFSPHHLIDLIRRQERGEWVTNGDTIRFDAEGQLRDGQHRLRMVKHTGIPIEVIVVKDIPSESFSTMDVGKTRNLGDVLYIEKETNHSQLASALGWVWRYLSRRMLGRKGSHEEHLKLLHEHPGVRDSVAFYLNLNHPTTTPGFRSVAMGIHYLFSQVDATAANDFITKYVTGLGLVESTDPIKILRDQMINYAIKPPKPTGDIVFTFLCKAWNAHQAGQPIKKKFKVPISKPASPKISGFPDQLFLEHQLLLEEEGEEGEEE